MKRLLSATISLLVLAACSATELEDTHNYKPPPTTASKFESLLRIGDASAKAGKRSAAIDLYQEAAALPGNRIDAHVKLAELYVALNQPQAAIEVLDAAEGRQSGDTALWQSKAATYLAAGQTKPALLAAQRAVALAPKDFRAHNMLGMTYDASEAYADAQASYMRAITLTGESDAAAMRNNLALSYMLSGDAEQAIPLLTKLLAEGRSSATIRQNLALAYGLVGDDDKALKLGLTDLDADAARDNLEFIRDYRSGR